VTTLAHLRALRNLLEKKHSWTKGASARNQIGEPVTSDDPEAVSWCLFGASRKVTFNPDLEHMYRHDGWIEVHDALLTAMKSLGLIGDYIGYNERRFTEHKDILALVNHAIELERTS
jgi:hypothetical protein